MEYKNLTQKEKRILNLIDSIMLRIENKTKIIELLNQKYNKKPFWAKYEEIKNE